MERSQQNKALLKGTAIYAIGNFGTKFLNFLIVPLYTYFIAPAYLGQYDLLMTTVSLLSPLITMKISDAAYRWIIKEKDNELPYVSATYQILLINCLIAACVLLGLNQIVPIWNCNYFIAILIGDRILECMQKILRGFKNQKLFVISGLLHTLILVGLNLYKICYLREGVVALLQSSVISLYVTIIFLLVCEKRFFHVSLFKNYRDNQKMMLKYSAPLVPSALSWWVMSASDRYVIRLVLGKVANGIYSVAYKFPSILQMVFIMFNNAWTDMALAELSQDDHSQEYTKKVFQQLYKFSFSTVFVLIPLTKLVMEIILSSVYKQGAVYIGFLYIGTVFQGFSSFYNIGYLQGKNTKGTAISSMIGAAVNLFVNVLCIHFIGLFAASISTFLGFFSMWLFRAHDIKKFNPIKVDVRLFSAHLCVAILLATVTIWTNSKMDFILVCIAAVIFILENKDNVQMILSLIRKKRKRA